jgi:Flp pilus assembly secretin CpaC
MIKIDFQNSENIKMKSILVSLSFTLCFGICSHAQSESLDIKLGEIRSISVVEAWPEVFVGNVEIVAIETRENLIILKGLKPGKTSMVILNKKGETSNSFDMTVTANAELTLYTANGAVEYSGCTQQCSEISAPQSN